MTGYTVHTGSSKKFSSGWDKVFKGGGQASAGKKQPDGEPAKKKKTTKQRKQS